MLRSPRFKKKTTQLEICSGCSQHCEVLTLSRQLLDHSSVLFAGYRIPHPLENYIVLKVQTAGTIDPPTAIAESINDLILETEHLKRAFAVPLALDSLTLAAKSRQLPRANRSRASGGPSVAPRYNL
jgi:DNA-directed RNA polymerase subunit L